MSSHLVDKQGVELTGHVTSIYYFLLYGGLEFHLLLFFFSSLRVFLPGKSHDRGARQATLHKVTKCWTRLERLNTHTGNGIILDY